MKYTLLCGLIVAVALILVGAACSNKTVNQSTNIVANKSAEGGSASGGNTAANVNYSSTGSFSTGTNN